MNRKEREYEEKKLFVKDYVSPLLQAAGINVKKADYRTTDDEELVVVTYNNGFKRDICVTADSLLQIVYDILRWVR